MSEIDLRRRRRRALAVAAPFAAGAAVGAAVLAGLGGVTSASGGASAATHAPSASSTQVASASARYDAEAIYDQAGPGVVHITVTQAGAGSPDGLSPFGPGDGSEQAQATGTGFVYDADGHIVTAAHVVADAAEISVRFSDGTTAEATLVGADPSSDTAVITVSVDDELTPLALADSSTVEPGQGVVAIGSPFGLEESISAGIVSAVGRDIEAPNGYTIPNAIQTDAAINHGNSGGPLIDESGEVIGVNVQIATSGNGGSGDNAGVGFAVPSNTVKAVADDLIAGRAVEHSYLGISVGDDPAGSGAQVGTVRAGSPAADAGLEAGDLIVAVDGEAIARAGDLTAAVAEHQPGDTIRLTVERDGSTIQLEATLGTRPETTTT